MKYRIQYRFRICGFEFAISYVWIEILKNYLPHIEVSVPRRNQGALGRKETKGQRYENIRN